MASTTTGIAPTLSLGTPLASVERVERLMLSLTGSDDQVSRAARYHLQAGGKRARARLALSCAAAVAVEPNDAIACAACCELLHNASLVHDDIQDGDEVRRGRASVWCRFGTNTALLTGDLMISTAYRAIAEIGTAWNVGALLGVVHARVATTIRGQSSDLGPGGDDRILDLAGYERIAAAKSGPLLSLPLELPLFVAGLARYAVTAREAAEAFAIGYQIADDLEDVAQDERPGRFVGSANVVSVIRASSPDICAEVAAARHAHAAFARAIAAAEALPSGAGDLLISLARGFQSRLLTWCGR